MHVSLNFSAVDETPCWIRAKQPLWVAPGGLQASGWQWASEAWLWLLPQSRLLQTTRAQASRPLHDKHAHSARTRDNRASVKCSDCAEDALWRHSDSVLGDKAEHTHDESLPLWATDWCLHCKLNSHAWERGAVYWSIWHTPCVKVQHGLKMQKARWIRAHTALLPPHQTGEGGRIRTWKCICGNKVVH